MTQTNLSPLRVMAAVLMAVCLIGCGSDQEQPLEESSDWAKIELTSTAFSEGQPIPRKYTGEGADASPPLSWSTLPEGTQQLALICDDPDAPRGTWVHWVVYGIPAAVTELPENFSKTEWRESKFKDVIEGENSFGDTGYGGPMPPSGDGKHRYFFKLYALDSELALEPGLDKQSLEEAIKGHVLGKGELMGTYER
ncbi:MAG: YbhB/YbcL family Raf kinase inhibitor-like protein [Planctomycetota bacterium]|jgi:Raf kinase inhibitor-like YbhB/YbcL family protein